jgi:pimeloyl-ACP methyl ester carboxylesterase
MQQTIENNGVKLAFNHTPADHHTGVMFCGGFNSSRNGQKALALETICARENIPYTRFDYAGHGDSEGEFTNGSIDTWLSDTLCIFDHIEKPEKQILIGSSMGAWIAVLAARQRKDRLAGLITIAAAPDFTERLMKQRFTPQQLTEFEQHGQVLLPSQYDDGSPYPITAKLINDSRQHCLLGDDISFDVPVRMLHGTSDNDVPYQLSIELLHTLATPDAQLTLIKNGDHRLSDPAHLQVLEQTLLALS